MIKTTINFQPYMFEVHMVYGSVMETLARALNKKQ